MTIIADPPELPDDGGGWEPRFLKLLDKLERDTDVLEVVAHINEQLGVGVQ